jgi:inosose dehydratase
MSDSRRKFLQKLSVIPALSLLKSDAFATETNALPKFPISSNAYNWFTFYRRENKTWGDNWNAHMETYAKTGLTAFEPSFNSPGEVLTIHEAAEKNGISIPSAYVNSLLHDKDKAQKSVDEVLAIATNFKKSGTRILVTNPTPIQWGGTETKSDEELTTQLHYLEMMGKELRKMDVILAYHTHDTEMMGGAKEFHHMLQNTSPENVSFCFDVHWVYRGSQNSQIAVFDILKMYGNRIVELHLRQSKNGVWKETFSAGDIDYQRFANELKKLKVNPNLVIEQCVEDKTPNTTDVVTAHIQDLKMVKEYFN